MFSTIRPCRGSQLRLYGQTSFQIILCRDFELQFLLLQVLPLQDISTPMYRYQVMWTPLKHCFHITYSQARTLGQISRAHLRSSLH